MPLIIDEKNIERLAKRKHRVKKGRPVKPSPKAERELFRKMNDLWVRVLFPATEQIKRMVAEGASPQAIADVIEQVLQRAEFDYGVNTQDIVTKWKLSVDMDTRRSIHTSLAKTLGVDIAAVVDDPVVADALRLGGMKAAELISKMPSQCIGEIAKAVHDNFIGAPLPEGRSLQEQISHIQKMTPTRAKLIARDQTSKLTGLVNQTRQQSIGIEAYIWRTVKDQRVVGNPVGAYPKGNKAHGDHHMMEGVWCRWDDPTVFSRDGGKTWIKRPAQAPKSSPGQDIQCRCHAEPVIDTKKIMEYVKSL